MKIVIERLTRATACIARYYLLKGYEVYCLSISRRLRDVRLVESGVRGRKVEALEVVPAMGMYLFEAHRLAFENVERVFAGNCTENAVIRSIVDLFGDGAAELAFKKELTRELFQFYLINYTVSVLKKHFGEEEFLFVPSRGEYPYFFDGVDRYRQMLEICRRANATLPEPSGGHLPVWITAWQLVAGVRDWLESMLKNAATVGLLLARLGTSAKCDAARRSYEYGITAIAPERQFVNDLQGIDFLVDGDKIRREEIVVVAGETLTDPYRGILRSKRLDYVEVGGEGWDRLGVRRALSTALRVLTLGLVQNKVIRDTARVLLLHFCKWSGFVSRIRLRHLVTYCDMELETIPRNILLKRDGTMTWHYIDSCNFPCYLAEREEEFDRFLHYRTGFLYYDNFISWSDQVSEYFRRHHTRISRYVTVGCLWAEHTRGLMHGEIRGRLRETVGWRADGKRIIGVFDSSFLDGTSRSYENGIAFLAGIMRLLLDMPDAFVILKEKKPRDFPTHAAEFKELYERLDRHPRCLTTRLEYGASEIVALSEVIIAFPFTSPGFEALSVRKKAIYFDAAGRFGLAFYDRAPGLVRRGYDELAKRVRELLCDVTDTEYAKYVEEYIEGKIVPNCDGLALTRFRELLLAARSGRVGAAVSAR